MSIKRASVLIRVSKETWRELNHRKEVGDSFDSVLRKTLELPPKKKEG